jgi:hypothetical protein
MTESCNVRCRSLVFHHLAFVLLPVNDITHETGPYRSSVKRGCKTKRLYEDDEHLSSSDYESGQQPNDF